VFGISGLYGIPRSAHFDTAVQRGTAFPEGKLDITQVQVFRGEIFFWHGDCLYHPSRGGLPWAKGGSMNHERKK